VEEAGAERSGDGAGTGGCLRTRPRDRKAQASGMCSCGRAAATARATDLWLVDRLSSHPSQVREGWGTPIGGAGWAWVKGNGNDEIQGSFAALRMTTKDKGNRNSGSPLGMTDRKATADSLRE